MIVRRPIDLKHYVEVEIPNSAIHPNLHTVDVRLQIIKSTNGQAIPDEEPTILFRGRDYLAIPLLEHYLDLCIADGATDFQVDQVKSLIGTFKKFATDFPDRMKQPGITRGL